MEWLKIVVRRSTLLRAIAALLWSSSTRHEEARRESDLGRSQQLREEAEGDATAHNELWNTHHGSAVMHDESIGGNSGPVQVTKLAPQATGRDLFWGVLLALSIAVNIWCAWEIRDIGTRKWLHDYDLSQFQMGPFAELQRQVGVDHELIKVFGPKNCQKSAEKQ